MKEESAETHERTTKSLCVELSENSVAQTPTSKPATEIPLPKPTPLPELEYIGPSFEKKLKLLSTLMQNRVVSRNPDVSAGEHINAAEILDNFCIVLGFDAGEELGGQHTVDLMKVVLKKNKNICWVQSLQKKGSDHYKSRFNLNVIVTET